MQWASSTSFSLLISLLHISTTSATSTARVWTNFYPSCPADHIDEPTSLHLDEQFTTAVDIDANVCQGIPVPLQFAPMEVAHLAIDAELLTKDPLDICRIQVHELPGCAAYTPLVDEPLVGGEAVSSCKPRGFSYSQVWLELVCQKAPEPAEVDEPSTHGAWLNATTNATSRETGGLWKRVVRKSLASIPTR
ncbi:hypothetical protein FE257_011552 [Aspergillus nanangensis]|uniref:Uncharacterized protein n=1 Tax=Aspergillus nanangensis TaxID=2582783 RepID=A0AAD4CIC4_ASPNN|nr:hypothetical protein FE257_011552 [Aspergillus nanangensis]